MDSLNERAAQDFFAGTVDECEFPLTVPTKGVGLSHQADLITSLRGVAGAVCSKLSVREALDTIVDRAKTLTEADKAVLVLTADRSDRIDLDTLLVRGVQEDNVEELGEARLAGIAARAFADDEMLFDEDVENGISLLAAPIQGKETPVGLICVLNSGGREFSAEHVDYLAILAAFAGSAVQNVRVAEQNRVLALTNERDRIAREMHDGLAQSLFSISLALEVCRKQVENDPAAVAVRLDDVQEQLGVARTELRRFIYDLRPMELANLGLLGAIDAWIREVTHDTDISGRMEVAGDVSLLSASQQASLYRVAKEAVSNVVRHSGAHRFFVRINSDDERVVLVISDDGHGFDPAKVLAGSSPGLGLRSIRERVSREGGRFMVSSRPDGGTTITLEMILGGAA